MLTRLLIKLTCIGVVAAGSMTWLAASQGKDPLAVFSTLSWRMPDGISLPPTPDLPALSDLVPGRAGTSTVYRWTDAQGTVQFSTSQPPDGTRFQTVHLDPDANVIPAIATERVGTRSTASGERHKPSVTRPVTEAQPSRADVGQIRDQLKALDVLNTDRVRHLDSQLSEQLR